VELIHGVVIAGGTIHGHGTATAVADFNFFCDPLAARHVVREPLPKTIVPVETTGHVVFGFDFLDHLPDESSRAGMIVRRMLPHSFRAAGRQILGREGIFIHDVVALVAVMHPELFDRRGCDGRRPDRRRPDDRHARDRSPPARPCPRRCRILLTACDAAAVTDGALRGLAAAE